MFETCGKPVACFRLAFIKYHRLVKLHQLVRRVSQGLGWAGADPKVAAGRSASASKVKQNFSNIQTAYVLSPANYLRVCSVFSAVIVLLTRLIPEQMTCEDSSQDNH